MDLHISSEQVYRDYKNKVFGYIFNRIHNHALAEELTSDVFVKIVANIERFDPEKASVSTWVFVITRNTLIEHFRKHRDSEDIDELEIPVTDEPIDRIVMEEQQELLAKALRELPENVRDIIVARYYYGFRFSKIGEMMGMTEANARVTHSRALTKLRELIGELL